MFPVDFVSSPAESHPACSPVRTEGPFPEVKRGRGVSLTTHHHIVLGSRMNRSYTSLPLVPCMAVAGQLYFLLFTPMLPARVAFWPMSTGAVSQGWPRASSGLLTRNWF
jgi:hypothetical protein